MKAFNVLVVLFTLAGVAVAQGVPSPNDPNPNNTTPPVPTATSGECSNTTVTTTNIMTITVAATTVTITGNTTTATTTVILGGNTTASPTSETTPVPTSTGVALHPNNDKGKCLDVRGAKFANGTPVQIFDCNGTPAQQWDISPGRGHVKVTGKNFCLDAGSSPKNGVGTKIWTCFDNLPAQDWFLTGDRRIALTDRGLCLDLTDGILSNSNRVQTWRCTDNDVNQVWT